MLYDPPQVDEEAELRNMDEARVRSLADREAEVAAQKPLALWLDAELLERFADSRVLPLVRRVASSIEPQHHQSRVSTAWRWM